MIFHRTSHDIYQKVQVGTTMHHDTAVNTTRYSIISSRKQGLPLLRSDAMTNIIEHAYRDLGSGKPTNMEITGTDTCTALDSKSLFCIYNQTGQIKAKQKIYISNNATQKSLKRIDNLIIRIQKNPNCLADQNITVVTTSKCFPLDYLYNRMYTHCPQDIRRFTDIYGNLAFPTGNYRLFVNSGIVLGQIGVNTTLLNQSLEDGIYDIQLKTNNKTFIFPIEYFRYSKDIVDIRNDTARVPVYSGKSFRVTINKEIYFEKANTVYIKIIQRNKKQDIITFHVKNSVILFGSERLGQSPKERCLQLFKQWRRGYQLMIGKGKAPKCTKDYRMYYAYLSYFQSKYQKTLS